ncbi:hypothetical protein M8J76_011594 [Diaphorina citri]|nr:hypothetical protein M8J75_012445 [Diaphorina citri]KAI5733412.1 hypothetical protein M8J76_011594 [Diaphorina citri]
MKVYTGLCAFSLLCLLCSAVQFDDQPSSVADYDYGGPEGRHLHGGLLKKKKKLKKEFKRKKKVLANCLLNSKFKRSLEDGQQKAAWAEEKRQQMGLSDQQKAALNEVVLRRIKRDRPQGRFLIPIPFAIQYTNVQTGGGYGGGHGSSSSSSSSSGDDEDGDDGDDCSSSDERYSDRFVGPYHSNDVYRQLYKSFMRWVL